MPFRHRTALAAALLLIACLFAAGPGTPPWVARAARAQSGVTVKIDRIGFEAQGRSRDGAWIPVVVTVENGGADLKGSVVVRSDRSDDAIVRQPIDLPGGGRKQISLLYRASLNQNALRVSFVSEGGAALADASQRLIVDDQSEVIAGVFGGPPATLAGLALPETNLNGIAPEAVPDRAAVLLNLLPETLPATDAELANFNVIALIGVEPSAAQAAALRRWVVGGGVLLIDGGPSALGIAPTLADLAPGTIDMAAPAASVQLASVLTATLDKPLALNARVVVPANGGTAAATASTAQGAPADERTVLAGRRLGGGAVWLTGFDIPSLPFGATTPEVWKYIIRPIHYNLWPINFGFSGLNDARLGLPDVSTLILLILGYILVVGPLNYLLLRRLDRREWAWGTIPAGVLVFMVVTYLAGGGLRGGRVTSQHFAIIDGGFGETDGRATLLYGFTGGQRGTWTAQIPTGLAPGAARFGQFFGNIDTRQPDIQLHSDGRVVLPDWVTNIGETRLLAAMGSAPIPYAIEISDQRLERGQWQAAKITNRGSKATPRSYLVSGDQYFVVAPLEPGASWTLDPLQAQSSFPYIFDGSDNPGIEALIATHDSIGNLTSFGGPNPPNSIYSLPRLVIIDREPVLAPTLTDGAQGNAVTIYNLYLPTEAR